MTTERLDLNDLATAAGDEPYRGAPDGARIGHIHLRVGDTDAAEKFYVGAVGLKVTRGGRIGATFMSSGGYHHHVGANIWHSRGAGPRDPQRAGLNWFAIEAADDAALDTAKAGLERAGVPVAARDGAFEVSDPWGTRLRLARG
jgi:catechol 2,3-dioxygenase